MKSSETVLLPRIAANALSERTVIEISTALIWPFSSMAAFVGTSFMPSPKTRIDELAFGASVMEVFGSVVAMWKVTEN